MAIREVARRFGRELQCHRYNVINRRVTRDLKIPEVIRDLDMDSRRVLMQWLTRHGPFWEDIQQHTGDDWLEYNGEIITDTAVGEAAYCLFHGIDRALVSIDPSSWLISPLSVDWYEKESAKRSIDINNYWDANNLEQYLATIPAPLKTWKDLEEVARRRYPDLTFSKNSFEPLEGYPLGKVAERLLSRLAVLHDLKNCFDKNGQMTPEGLTIRQKYFTGANSWFSDSSATEKTKFKNKLTFPHPANPEEFLFCTWHGKVKTSQLRIHFSWPIRANTPLYIVYVGPKKTKR